MAGLARQPYFREADGALIRKPGYDFGAQIFSVFDPNQFPTPQSTPDAARTALALLEELLTEFHFVADTDRAGALAAIFTAVARPSVDFAPGFHVRAPAIGSGKTYLCELIGSFAGPGWNSKVSYPLSSEEATKVIFALLLTSPAVIEFDDMTTDWIPHGIINRLFTARTLTERILGVSKTATVSTRTLVLGSGNNVEPLRDLRRRVLTIHLDQRCATPATRSYNGNPVERVRGARGKYVGAVLTIIQAWRAAGSPRVSGKAIATFGGKWSDYCRFPLMWLGQPDPLTSLVEQVNHDPDAKSLEAFLLAWHSAFGSTPTPLRRAISDAEAKYPDLIEAIGDLPVMDRGDEINRTKFGQYLKKNQNRIVEGLELRAARADGRNAWFVLTSKTPPSPPSPPFAGAIEKDSGADDVFPFQLSEDQ